MKMTITFILIFLFNCNLGSSDFIYKRHIESNYKQGDLNINEKKSRPVKITTFMKRLKRSESCGGSHRTISTTGCLGFYQFQKVTLFELGYDTSSAFIDSFLVTPNLQHIAFKKLIKRNRKYLKKYIIKYEGITIDSIEVTEAGILAGAHLGGPGGVLKWLSSNGEYNPSDKYGTRISDYVKKFSDIKNIQD